MRVVTVALMALSTAACATGGDEIERLRPDLTPVLGRPLTPTARLALACVDQAQTSGGVDMIAEDDGEGRMIRFTCSGAPAEALFAALEPRSVAIGSEWVEGGAVHRSTERMQENLYGLDFCRSEGSAHACVLNLNLGAFIAR